MVDQFDGKLYNLINRDGERKVHQKQKLDFEGVELGNGKTTDFGHVGVCVKDV